MQVMPCDSKIKCTTSNNCQNLELIYLVDIAHYITLCGLVDHDTWIFCLICYFTVLDIAHNFLCSVGMTITSNGIPRTMVELSLSGCLLIGSGFRMLCFTTRKETLTGLSK